MSQNFWGTGRGCYTEDPQRTLFLQMVECDFRTTPDFTSKAPVRCGWTRLWLPCTSSSLALAFPTFIKPLAPLQAHPSCSKALELSQSSATLFLLVCLTGKPSNEGPAFMLSFLPEPLQLYATLKAALTGYGLALTAHLDAKQTPGRLHSMPSVHVGSNGPSFPFKVIYLIT